MPGRWKEADGTKTALSYKIFCLKGLPCCVRAVTVAAAVVVTGTQRGRPRHRSDRLVRKTGLLINYLENVDMYHRRVMLMPYLPNERRVLTHCEPVSSRPFLHADTVPTLLRRQ